MQAVDSLAAQANSAQNAGNAVGNPVPLLLAGSILLAIVLIGLPWLATKVAQKSEIPLKGLGLPAGSVRSMLALMTVGTFVVVAMFGQSALESSEYERVLTTLATLAGPVLGFYFGSRGSGRGSEVERPAGRGDDADPSEAGEEAGTTLSSGGSRGRSQTRDVQSSEGLSLLAADSD